MTLFYLITNCVEYSIAQDKTAVTEALQQLEICLIINIAILRRLFDKNTPAVQQLKKNLFDKITLSHFMISGIAQATVAQAESALTRNLPKINKGLKSLDDGHFMDGHDILH